MLDIPRDVKYGGQDGLRMLHILMADVWHKGVQSEDWKKALIVPYFKRVTQLTLTSTEASACLGRSLPLCSRIDCMHFCAEMG